MFFKKKELVEAPLNYWEEKSYVLAIPKNPFRNPMIGLFDRVACIDGLSIIDKRDFTLDEPGYMKVSYFDYEYEIGFYPSGFCFHDFYINNSYYFEESDLVALREARGSFTVFMRFGPDSKRSYHLQLKVVDAIIPDMIGLLDESAEKMLPAKWVSLMANSSVLPSFNDLFTVQAVMDKKNNVWLHTHGLCRCGFSELEILGSDVKNYNNHCSLLTTYAGFLIDGKGTQDYACVGMLSNMAPIMVTSLPWTLGVFKYDNLKLGGVRDRKSGHNSRSNVIFLYESEDDRDSDVVSKVSIYDDLWGDNPIFFFSNEETERMALLARERFDLVKKYCDSDVLIKIGLDTDDGSFEHIWFSLVECDGDRFLAKLTQEPYDVSDVHTGDLMWFDVSRVTDWIIYTKDFRVTPSSAYLLR